MAILDYLCYSSINRTSEHIVMDIMDYLYYLYNLLFNKIGLNMMKIENTIADLSDAAVFIDLEGCLIESWFNRTIIPELKPVIDKLHDIKLFTFAIFSDEDMADFEKNIKPEIEKFFNKPISLVESRANLIPILNGDEHNGRHIQPAELTDFYTKSEAFRAYISHKFDTGKYVLIDDGVVDSTLIMNEGNLIIQTCFFNNSKTSI